MSAPPQANFGYKGRRSSSDKDVSATKDKPSVHKVSSAGSYRNLRSSSNTGSETSELNSPTTPSEVFHSAEVQLNHTSASKSSETWETTSTEDKGSLVGTVAAVSEVNVSTSCTSTVVSCASSSEPSEVNSQLPSQVDLSKPNADTTSSLSEANAISFYLTSEDESEDHSEVSEHATGSVGPSKDQDGTSELNPSSTLVEVAHNEADEEKRINPKDTGVVKQEDAATDNQVVSGLSVELDSATSDRKADEKHLSASSETSETDVLQNQDGRTIIQNLTAEQIISDDLEEHIVPTKVLKTRSEPNIFVFPDLPNHVVQNKHPDIVSIGSEPSQGTEASEHLHTVTDDIKEEDLTLNASNPSVLTGTLLTTSDMTAALVGNEAQTSDTTVDACSIEQPELISSVSSNEAVLLPETTSSSSLEVCPSTTPDLLSSLPFLPLLTPYGSEERAPERIHSASEDEVFIEDVKTDGLRYGNKPHKELEETIGKEASDISCSPLITF